MKIFALTLLLVFSFVNESQAKQFTEFGITQDGLALVGDFKLERPTVIFIHGFSPYKAQQFPELTHWNNKFNTFIFRWHWAAAEGGVSLDGSEAKVWNDFTSRFLSQFKNYFSAKSEYKQEIRFVGHSMGTQVATLAAHILHAENSPFAPSRLEILDAYSSSDGVLPSNPHIDSSFGPLVKNAMVKILETLSRQIAVVNYAGTLSSFVLSDLKDKVHTQKLHKDFMKNADGGSHQQFLPYYFSSITSPAPKATDSEEEVFSAHLSTSEIISRSHRIYTQTGGINSSTISDDIYSSEK